MNNNITIIGAGLVGSLTAIILARQGVNVEVYEKRPDRRHNHVQAGRSINLALANRGIYALEEIDLMDTISPILTPMKGRMIHKLEGELHYQPYGQRKDEVIYSASRADLNALLLDAAQSYSNVSLHFNQKCTHVDFENNQLYFVNEDNSTTWTKEFTQVIGTDGSASAVREAILKQHSSTCQIEPLGHAYKELHIPAGEDGQFQMEPHALHIWPRGNFMLIALPNQDKSFTVTLFMPIDGTMSFSNITTDKQITDFFKQQFPDTLKLIPNIIRDFNNNPTGRLSTIRCSPWAYQGKGLILGDAAHAIVPFHGQGMNCGFEDVSELNRQIQQTPNNWEQIFLETQKNRQPNAAAIADMALENYITMRDSVRQDEFLLKKDISFELEKRFPAYYCPRYSMVMFHILPYAQAQQRGKIQDSILEQLMENISSISQVDYALAESLIKERLQPLKLDEPY